MSMFSSPTSGPLPPDSGHPESVQSRQSNTQICSCCRHHMQDRPTAKTTEGFFEYSLPPVIQSARDGWQSTSQSGAVVSGLLAAVASQLLGYFEGGLTSNNINNTAGSWVVIAFCYAALFLNINATIGSFILTDKLGELGYEGAKKGPADTSTVGVDRRGVSALFKEYGMTSMWSIMLVHWLITFYLGILTLIISVITYVGLVEKTSILIVMCFLIALTLFPTSYFIFAGGYQSARAKHQVARNSNS
ncbi:hypothetical protein CPB83DRAFT_805950 [Crepidotus variabilis]|uniref:Uncharacterized protein n=1 Tax=Crepidotus variabilis TaxID=179855 RepID=A0A9P6EQ67_9AGAR|nr:hypothetical protein CPB83DRAFT_805950 [Crepidotus variabilis]